MMLLRFSFASLEVIAMYSAIDILAVWASSSLIANEQVAGKRLSSSDPL